MIHRRSALHPGSTDAGIAYRQRSPIIPRQPSASDRPGPNKAYTDGRFGQIHLRETAPVPGRIPLVCLHATAYSSRTFEPLMAAYAGIRQVIAIDAPGYGGSDAPPRPITMEDYADAVGTAIAARCDGPVELLGYHTGAYIGAQLAIDLPAAIARLVLIGIPYFEALDRDHWRALLTKRHVLAPTLAQFDERWDYLVAKPHAAGLALSRAFGNFIDELRAWPNGWWAHEAMFDWDSAAKLPRIAQPVLVLNPPGHLAVASRTAAALMPNAQVIEMPDLPIPALEHGADAIMEAIEANPI